MSKYPEENIRSDLPRGLYHWYPGDFDLGYWVS